MIGVTITPSQIDYSKIIDDEMIHDLVYGEAVILTGFAKELCPVDKGQLKNSIMTAMQREEYGFNAAEKSSATLATTHKTTTNTGKTRTVHDKIKLTATAKEQAPWSSKLRHPSSTEVAYVGSGLEYAGPVEYGRSDMPNYPRQPYLRPAIDYSKTAREKRRQKVVRIAIEKAYENEGK